MKKIRKITSFFSKKRFLCRITEIIRHIFSKLNREILIDDFDGDLFFYCRLNEHITSSIFWKGYYSEPELNTLSSLLEEDSVFIDIGANKGVFTIFSAKRLSKGRVLSFEPADLNLKILEKNIIKNGFKNIKLFKIGLSDKSQTIPIYGPSHPYLDGTKNEGALSIFSSNKVDQFLQKIAVDTLDHILEKEDLKKINVIKIDVEGSEPEVLRGMYHTLVKFKPLIMIEINEKVLNVANHTSVEIITFLNSLGYRYKPAGDITHRDLNEDEIVAYRDILCIPR
jgi:FkbM family methyltransferase